MRKSFLIAICLLSFATVEGRSPHRQVADPDNPGNYTIKVHISATHFRKCAVAGPYPLCGAGFYVDADVNGRKVELFGQVDKYSSPLIVPGDYQASLPKKTRDGGREVLSQMYYVLLPNKTAWLCEITGFSE